MHLIKSTFSIFELHVRILTVSTFHVCLLLGCLNTNGIILLFRFCIQAAFSSPLTFCSMLTKFTKPNHFEKVLKLVRNPPSGYCFKPNVRSYATRTIPTIYNYSSDSVL